MAGRQARAARRAGAARALLEAVRGSRAPGAPGVGERLAALPRLAAATLSGRYEGMRRSRLALLAVGLLYLVSPVDLVPEAFLFLFGLGDDALVAAWLAGTVLSETDAYLDWERDQGRDRGREQDRPRGREHRRGTAGGPVVAGEVVSETRLRR